MKILVSDKLDKEGVEKMKAAGHEVLSAWDEPKEKLPSLIADCDAIVVRSGTKVTKDLIDAGQKLKVIGRAGIGLDNVDKKHADSKGIKVVNTPTATTVSVAELTMGLMLAAHRPIVDGTVTTRAGKWEKKTLKGTEIFGKTLGVIGIGRIGDAVADRAHAFGMTVIAYDPYMKSQKWKNVTYDELLAQSDVLTFHLPKTDETKHMLSTAQFAKMKQGAVIVNCARGGVVDEHALLDAMKSGKVRAYATDVFEEEPPKDMSLVNQPGVICTPHIGAQTAEGQKRAGVMVAEAVIEELKKL